MGNRAIVLINLGTPESPDSTAVGRFLIEFLMDPLVMQMPGWQRALLVRGLIVPFRKSKSAEKYRQIWTERGSPLMVCSEDLLKCAQKLANANERVYLAMRYGKPSIRSIVAEIREAGIREVVVIPLFPQYAESTYLSAQRMWEKEWDGIGSCEFLAPYYAERFFIDPQVALAKRLLEDHTVDHWIFSFHGLPESHIAGADTSGHCLQSESCCEVLSERNSSCYRAQCFHTAKLLAGGLKLPPGGWTMTFQSRLGRGKWLTPSTEGVVLDRLRRGALRVAVMCPSFVTDGLETLEEIGSELRDKFLEAGGEELLLVPSLNDNVDFVSGLMAAARGGRQP